MTRSVGIITLHKRKHSIQYDHTGLFVHHSVMLESLKTSIHVIYGDLSVMKLCSAHAGASILWGDTNPASTDK